jgi:hypothetical protein
VERELTDDYRSYHGTLCASWLQEEIVTLDAPCSYALARRYAARYVRITVLAASQAVLLRDIRFDSISSADSSALPVHAFPDEELAAIDRVAVRTLHGCMQRVFEDGPKRDRRLWIGDLRLEALTNYYTFQNLPLVRRCLYLFAAAEPDENGFPPAYVYESPDFVSGSWYLWDYALLYVCALCDYCDHTDDAETLRELFPVAKRIIDGIQALTDENGLLRARSGCTFIDWCPGLKKSTALMGVYLYTLEKWERLCAQLHLDEEAKSATRALKKGRDAALAHLYDAERGAFINERDERQYSIHATAWMILGGVLNGEKAKKALSRALASDTAIKPNTPYMSHYVTQALLRLDMHAEAIAYLRHVWGQMLRAGGDTFPEIFRADDAEFSPYRDRMINSMCHAWSCTPAYLIRKYGKDVLTDPL